MSVIDTIPLQNASRETFELKYQLKDEKLNPVEFTVEDMFERVARKLSEKELESESVYENFMYVLRRGATGAGRIMSNAGAEKYKSAVSLINCTVSQKIKDSMYDILDSNLQAGMTLKAGCGIGYEFSTLRPRFAFVAGPGATTSGPVSFMTIFNATTDTVSSAGGRRGAQMATMFIWHPDIEEFISCKRKAGHLRQFNLSVLLTDEFMEALEADEDWDLFFPVSQKELKIFNFKEGELKYKKILWEESFIKEAGYTTNEKCEVLCRIYKVVKAQYLYDLIMKSTYDFAEPGILFISKINEYNNNYFCEMITATNPCGEQPLPPEGACLLGSINLANLVKNPFTPEAYFDEEEYIKMIKIFSRFLDNVVEFNGLPLEGQRKELEYKRRHGMGYLGLGSAFSMLGIRYGSDESVALTERISMLNAVEGFRAGIELAIEKGCAPIFNDDFTYQGVTKNAKEWWVESKFMKQIWEVAPELKPLALQYGCRYTHATSIAPTGTISFSINNNVSSGIEPTFSHVYERNIIKPGKNVKVSENVYSYEMLLYKHITGSEDVPESFSVVNNVSTEDHVRIQAAAQKWVDSCISKTINVPTDANFDEFKNIYISAYKQGLKGATTFRFNPEAFQGVLVNTEDLRNTFYTFQLESGEEITVNGTEKIEYDGEIVQANNLYDAIKEGYYGEYK